MAMSFSNVDDLAGRVDQRGRDTLGEGWHTFFLVIRAWKEWPHGYVMYKFHYLVGPGCFGLIYI